MNNAVKDARGRVIGFRCWRCRGVFDSMWGVVCNCCREQERRHEEIVAAIKSTALSERGDL